MIAKFVSAALATLRTGGTDWISFQIGVPRVVTKSWIWFAMPSLAVLLSPMSEMLGRLGIPGIGTSPSTLLTALRTGATGGIALQPDALVTRCSELACVPSV